MVKTEKKTIAKSKRSLRHQTCCAIAFHYENILPNICMEIIEKVYGTYRAEHMRPHTLADIVSDMMHQWVSYEGIYDDCMDAVQDWINSY